MTEAVLPPGGGNGRRGFHSRRKLSLQSANLVTFRRGWPDDRRCPERTRWLYCVECPQYSIRLEGLGYLCTSCLLPAFDEAYGHVTQWPMVIGCLRLSDVSVICPHSAVLSTHVGCRRKVGEVSCTCFLFLHFLFY